MVLTFSCRIWTFNTFCWKNSYTFKYRLLLVIDKGTYKGSENFFHHRIKWHIQKPIYLKHALYTNKHAHKRERGRDSALQELWLHVTTACLIAEAGLTEIKRRIRYPKERKEEFGNREGRTGPREIQSAEDVWGKNIISQPLWQIISIHTTKPHWQGSAGRGRNRCQKPKTHKPPGRCLRCLAILLNRLQPNWKVYLEYTFATAQAECNKAKGRVNKSRKKSSLCALKTNLVFWYGPGSVNAKQRSGSDWDTRQQSSQLATRGVRAHVQNNGKTKDEWRQRQWE